MKKAVYLLLALLLITVTANADAAILITNPLGGLPGIKLTLESARTSSDCSGKTIVVTSALTQVQSNISGAWPSDRVLEFRQGGSISNSTAFAINCSFQPVLFQIFNGAGAVTFGPGSVAQVYPEMWGAKADGTTMSRAACAAAIATGKDVTFSQGTYYMGAVAPSGTLNQEYLFYVNGVSGQKFRFNGAIISVNITNSGQLSGFLVNNSSHISWEGFRIINTGTAPDGTAPSGLAAIYLSGSSAIHTMSVSNMRAEKCLSPIMVAAINAGVSVADNISIDGLYTKDCLYGPLFQNSGDNVKIKNYISDGATRAYFAYGVSHHDIDMEIRNNLSTSGACMIKTYDVPTQDIRVNAWYRSGVASGLVVMEQQPTVAGTGLMSDIRVYVNDEVADGNPAVIFRSYLTNGTLETSTANQWNRIAIDGKFSTGTGVNSQILVQSTPNYATLTLSPAIMQLLSQSAAKLYFPGFILRQPEGDYLTFKQNPTTSTVLCPAVTGGPATMHKVTIFAQDSMSNVASAVRQYSEDLVTGYSAAGSYAVQQVDNLQIKTYGGTLARSFSQSGNQMAITFTGAPFNNANGYMIIKIENVGNVLK